jgi:signal transduction histidine kinase
LVEERERIARELHDGASQSLCAVGLSLEGTAGMVVESRVAARLQDAVTEIDRAIVAEQTAFREPFRGRQEG